MVWNTGALRILVLVLFSMAALHNSSAYAQSGSSSGAVSVSSSNQRVIAQLTAAKNADWQAAMDPDVSLTRQGTFLNQMNKADRAIKELTHGFSVSQDELNDALWMPPKHMTEADRARLIEQLKQARQQDDANEQLMLNDLAWSRSGFPVHTTEFDERKAKIDALIKDLEIGEHVRYSDIREALSVIPSPY